MSKNSRTQYAIKKPDGSIARVASPSVAFDSSRIQPGCTLIRRTSKKINGRIRNSKWEPVEYKQVQCTMVRVRNIVLGSYVGRKTDAKVEIECGGWIFPCLSYKYDDIRRGLERAICSVLGLASVTVTDFLTNIVEY